MPSIDVNIYFIIYTDEVPRQNINILNMLYVDNRGKN